MTAIDAAEASISGVSAGVADGSSLQRKIAVTVTAAGTHGFHCMPRRATTNSAIAALPMMTVMIVSPIASSAGSGCATIDGTLSEATTAALGKRTRLNSSH